MRLTNKVALITGAASGIGRETALLFAREGAAVICVDVNDAEGAQTVSLIQAQRGNAAYINADVSKAADCARMVEFAENEFGQLNILFNNAGIEGKLGPIGARSNTMFTYANVKVRPGDTVWYDAWNDFLAPADGWQMTSENDLFYMTKFGLWAGARYTVSMPFRPGPGTHQRVGPVALYEFFDKPGSAFNKPALVAMVQWFFQHPYRTGPLPQFILAFIFQGEIPLQKR